jgi:hypothetical protein
MGKGDDDFPLTYFAQASCGKHNHTGISTKSQADAQQKANQAAAACRASQQN